MASSPRVGTRAGSSLKARPETHPRSGGARQHRLAPSLSAKSLYVIISKNFVGRVDKAAPGVRRHHVRPNLDE